MLRCTRITSIWGKFAVLAWVGCGPCACAASGHTTAAPPSSVMNSRRLLCRTSASSPPALCQGRWGMPTSKRRASAVGLPHAQATAKGAARSLGADLNCSESKGRLPLGASAMVIGTARPHPALHYGLVGETITLRLRLRLCNCSKDSVQTLYQFDGTRWRNRQAGGDVNDGVLIFFRSLICLFGGICTCSPVGLLILRHPSSIRASP